MSQRRLSIHTQTPPIRFLHDATPGTVPSLADYEAGVDFERSPGGVTRMIGGLVRHLLETDAFQSATWWAVGRHGPAETILPDGASLRSVRLAEMALPQYADAKATLWRALHGLQGPAAANDALPRVRRGLQLLARAMGESTAVEHRRRPFDVFYVHDFQLLPLARFLPADRPRIFRWHIPVPAAPSQWLEFVVDEMNAYDRVVVSTRAYATRLRQAGVHVPVDARYPYVDESERHAPGPQAVADLERRLGLAPDDVVFTVVARLDPMKSQDVAIRALSRIVGRHPRAKLLLVGGGGFSGGQRASLGLPFAQQWKEELLALARASGVAHAVVFAGSLDETALDAAYARSRAVLLPSSIEGFGLAVVEAWLHGRPVVVSEGAGVAELVVPGQNGFVHSPGNDAELAVALAALAEDETLADALGRGGARAAQACCLAEGAGGIARLLRAATAAPRLPRLA